ncbi:hypothetical protein [Natronomonas amylolytica]|uniref:hypothetical protein n=1 Tax=Natronomonas amylolytica TaxID=3108498 RepID=UPI003008C256
MRKSRGQTGTDIDSYAGADVTAGRLALLHHPVVHSIRVLNHRRAEGIGIDEHSEVNGTVENGDE